MPKKILSISDNDALRVTRHMMLQNRSFEVASVANLRETRNALKTGGFDLVILCVSIDANEKREMASMARKLCEGADPGALPYQSGSSRSATPPIQSGASGPGSNRGPHPAR